MGLWLKQEDGTLVEVGGGGGGGSFDGEHVLTGDPDSPPEGWAAGQLLYDGVEDTGGGSEPHDHDEYALVEHDHDEFTHDHDYLPLSGGQMTGAVATVGNVYQLDATYVRGRSGGVPGFPTYSWVDQPEAGFYLLDGTTKTVGMLGKLRILGDLQVDGQLNFGEHAAGPIINLFNNPDGSNQYGFGLNTNLVAFWAGGKQVGGFDSLGNLYLDGAVLATRGVAFSIATGIDTQDVLDRAETATMPVLDDEGVATADVDSITVNEVVTALLAKVKELSTEIKELKGN